MKLERYTQSWACFKLLFFTPHTSISPAIYWDNLGLKILNQTWMSGQSRKQKLTQHFSHQAIMITSVAALDSAVILWNFIASLARPRRWIQILASRYLEKSRVIQLYVDDSNECLAQGSLCRCLIVLDDIWTKSSLEQFKFYGCCATFLVTSRNNKALAWDIEENHILHMDEKLVQKSGADWQLFCDLRPKSCGFLSEEQLVRSNTILSKWCWSLPQVRTHGRKSKGRGFLK